jgi:hypothetical protein
LCAASEKQRVVPVRRTLFGRMLKAEPPWIEPTLTTAGSRGESSRETIVWRASTMRAAPTMAS